MTNSMIPHSFIPGTKAKASEVNENFISLANFIEQNKALASTDIEDLKDTVDTKADKTEIITEHIITIAGENLDNYKTYGTYIFSSAHTPSNVPDTNYNAGVLRVLGDENYVIKQIWFCAGNNSPIYTRTYYESTKWTSWTSLCGYIKKAQSGYLELANGLILQWGSTTAQSVTYPKAFSTYASPVFMKCGYAPSHERSDTGFITTTLTGFTIGTGGICSSIRWVALGY